MYDVKSLSLELKKVSLRQLRYPLYRDSGYEPFRHVEKLERWPLELGIQCTK